MSFGVNKQIQQDLQEFLSLFLEKLSKADVIRAIILYSNFYSDFFVHSPRVHFYVFSFCVLPAACCWCHLLLLWAGSVGRAL